MTFKIGDRVKLVCRFNKGATGTVVGHPSAAFDRARALGESPPVDDVYVRRDAAGTTDCLRYSSDELELLPPEKTPRPHAELIKAWADGAVIQKQMHEGSWLDQDNPYWNLSCIYRIKPEAKPDLVLTRNVAHGHATACHCDKEYGTPVKYTFDGETGKLKAVELINGD